MKYLSIKHADETQILNPKYLVSIHYLKDGGVLIDYWEGQELVELAVDIVDIEEVDSLLPQTSKIRFLTANEIIKKISDIYNIPEDEITGRGKTTLVVKARHIAMWLCCNLTGLSTTEIGKFFGGDHTIVIYGRDRADRDFRSELDDLLSSL